MTTEFEAYVAEEDRCVIREGLFIDPCEALLRSFGHGVEHVHMANMKNGIPTRSFVIIKSGEYKKKGLIANCCPFCGTRIDAPILENLKDA